MAVCCAGGGIGRREEVGRGKMMPAVCQNGGKKRGSTVKDRERERDWLRH